MVTFHPITNREHPVIARNRALIAERRVQGDHEQRAYAPINSERAYEILVGSGTSSGAPVTALTALGVPAVAACVGLLADMIALLPLRLYRRTDRGDVEVRDHAAAQVIQRPGDLHTAFECRQLTMTGVGLGGNGYIRVHRSGNGEPGELEWLAPVDVMPQRLNCSRFVSYQVHNERNLLTRFDLIHVRGLSRDGIMGVSPITQMRESIGTSISQREAAGNLMKNGARFNGVLEAPAALRAEQVNDIRKEWAARHEGTANSGKTPVLWGAQFKPVTGMSAADAQFLESRVFELREIARWYRIPPVLIGDTQASTSFGAGIEQQNLGFLAYSLNPWLVNWEQSCDYTLLTSDEQRAGLHFGFDREEIAAVSLQAKAAFISTLRTTGVFSPNDAREWLDYPKSDAPGMDDARAPLNSSSSGSSPSADPQHADTTQ